MVEIIQEFFADTFGELAWLGILLIAMIPIIELRGAIPFALDAGKWGINVLTWWEAYLSSVVGATLPALLIVPLLIPVFNWLKKTKLFRKFVEFLDSHFKKKSENLANKVEGENELKKKERIKFWGVVTFVAIPLPLTGAWTGSAVAAYLGLGMKKGVLAVLIGNMISGAIMSIICVIFKGFEDLILEIFLWLALVVIVCTVLYGIVKIIKNKKVPVSQPEKTE